MSLGFCLHGLTWLLFEEEEEEEAEEERKGGGLLKNENTGLRLVFSCGGKHLRSQDLCDFWMHFKAHKPI